MSAIADTGFIYAVINPEDHNHRRAGRLMLALRDPILIPAIALVEIAFLAQRDGGPRAVPAILRACRRSPAQLTDLINADYDRALDILDKYADSRIDFVDACIMALAERLNITRILTFDHRDFGLYRPAHVERFDLLP